MNKKIILNLLMGLTVAGCATNSEKVADAKNYRKVVIDSSVNPESKPEWVGKSQMSWEQNGKIMMKGIFTIAGHQRVNGCYDLAKVEAKKSLLTSLQEEIKGYLDSGSSGLSESEEIIFKESVSASYKGKIQGMRYSENYFERYVIDQTERIDCFVMMELDKNDYFKLKRSVLNEASKLHPELEQALVQKQINFFKGDSE